jgi:hypothetical protein
VGSGPRRTCTRFVIAVAVVATCLTGCAGGRERALLDQFFNASRIRDLTALGSVATVVFEPREQGTVLSFDITATERHGDTEDVRVSAMVRSPRGDIVRKDLNLTITAGRVTSVTPAPPPL